MGTGIGGGGDNEDSARSTKVKSKGLLSSIADTYRFRSSSRLRK